jgi:RES domain-containing protein
LDQDRHAATWDTGEGAYRVGGRWNSKGVRAVYCSLDPATAILEVAVHKGFRTLDTVAHVLTKAELVDPSHIFVVDPTMIPNKNWLRPCIPSAGQQTFGNNLLAKHRYVIIPSVVSVHSWNLIFDAPRAAGFISNVEQDPFSLDTRLDPA